LAGCSFQASPANASADAAIDSPAAPHPGPDAPPAPPGFCDPTDATTMVCFDFDDGTANDKSIHHLPVHAQGLAFLPGEVGLAMQFAVTSTADLDDSPVFDVDALTIEAWIRPTALPDNVADILDVNDQYAFLVESDGTLHCLLSDTGASIEDGRVAAGAWSHVACTYDGATGVANLYINGARVSQQTGGGPMSHLGTTGLSLAADNPPGPPPPAFKPPPDDPRTRFIGMLDQVRLSNRARTDHEICVDAGLTSCP
jgi:hypothetical protein